MPDDDSEDLPDVGVETEINPQSDQIEFREDPLSLAKIAAVRPFQQNLSDEQPIRIVRSDAGRLLVMEGNHRVYAARVDGLMSIRARVCSLDEWQTAYGRISQRRGNNNPGFQA